MHRIVTILSVIALGTAACGEATTPQATGDGPPAAPSFSVTTFGGETFDLDEARGRPVVLNFFESW